MTRGSVNACATTRVWCTDVFVFGDDEPEDAWDPIDPVPELIDNLRRRMALLEVAIAGDFADVAELDGLEMRLAAWRLLRNSPPDAELERARMLEEDLAYVRSRI